MTLDEIVAACLEREVAARRSDSREILVWAYRFSWGEAIQDFDLHHRRSIQRDTITHCGTLSIVEADDTALPGPP